MRRLRIGSLPRTSLAVAGILATPLAFAALMAMSLAVERPTVDHVLRHGRRVAKLGDPSGANEAAVWLLAAAWPVALAGVGVLAMALGRRGVAVSALAAIAAAVALLVPLGSWARDHTARYPDGVDLIPRSAGSADIYLRGEWEASARRTARELCLVTIGMAGVALATLAVGTFRRRRAPLAPPPPEGVHAPDATPPRLGRA